MADYTREAFNDSSIVHQCSKDFIFKAVEQFLSLFYILSPFDNTYDDLNEVPNYEVALFPVVSGLFLTEQVLRFIQRKDLSRFQDIVINSGSSLLYTLARVFTFGLKIMIFSWLYNNYRIIDLPLHSIFTWILSLLLVEFVYYWTHRALHEVNILWAAHQFHHMAEDVNISTTVRDSIVDLIIYDIFPLPLAIIIPPQILLVHIQFSLIYQIWLHNEVIGSLGFVEYIINTPRQHRVHHGKNPYCIDKNYGALIMIWDRIFGTYQTEKEKMIFGVVSPTPQTYDSMVLQFGYYRDVWHKFKTVDGFCNKMSAIFKGPGWSSGKPRLGLISDVPEPDPFLPKYSYDPYIPFWKNFYIGIHGSLLMLGFYILADHPYIRFSPLKGMIGMFYIILFLTSIGTIFDNRKYAPILESMRCLIYYVFEYNIIVSNDWNIDLNMNLILNSLIWSSRVIHFISIIFWILFFIFSYYKNNENNDNNFESREEKNIESDTSSLRKSSKFHTFFILFGLAVLALIFTIAWVTRLESCTLMINHINI